MFFKAQNADGIESTYHVSAIMRARESADGYWRVTIRETGIEVDVKVPECQNDASTRIAKGAEN
jgi:hypothetical protein